MGSVRPIAETELGLLRVKTLFRKGHTLSPEDVLFVPGADRGIFFLAPPRGFWRPVPVGQIAGVGVSAHPEIAAKIWLQISLRQRSGTFGRALAFPTAVAVLTDVTFDGPQPRIGSKWLATGAAAHRIRNALAINAAVGYRAARQSVDAFLTEKRQTAFDMPIWNDPGNLPKVAAIWSGNPKNYFHFLTETIPQIHVLASSGLAFDTLNLHCRSTKVSGFAMAMIADYFPALAPKVRFLSGTQTYDRVLSTFSFNVWYPEGPATDAPVETEAEADIDAENMDLGPAGKVGKAGAAACDQALMDFRSQAISVAERIHGNDDFSDKIFVKRKPGQSRDRKTAMEDVLEERLAAEGFRTVHFEDHSPLQQVALMHRAQQVVASHGAGLANMIFAAPQTAVVEIGTLQTCRSRWGNFVPLAHVATCSYSNIFVDFNKTDALIEPDFTVESIVPPALSQMSIDAISDYSRYCTSADFSGATGVSAYLYLSRLFNSGQEAEAFARTRRMELTDGAGLEVLSLAAKIFDAKGEHRLLLDCLEVVARISKPRKERFERLAWLCSRLALEEKLAKHLAQYRDLFPDDYAAFVKRARRFRDILPDQKTTLAERLKLGPTSE